MIFLLNKNADYDYLTNLLVHFTPINTPFGHGWFKTLCDKLVSRHNISFAQKVQDIHRDCSILTIKHQVISSELKKKKGIFIPTITLNDIKEI